MYTTSLTQKRSQAEINTLIFGFVRVDMRSKALVYHSTEFQIITIFLYTRKHAETTNDGLLFLFLFFSFFFFSFFFLFFLFLFLFFFFFFFFFSFFFFFFLFFFLFFSLFFFIFLFSFFNRLLKSNDLQTLMRKTIWRCKWNKKKITVKIFEFSDAGQQQQ